MKYGDDYEPDHEPDAVAQSQRDLQNGCLLMMGLGLILMAIALLLFWK